jgi:hypothetical protein
MKLEEKSDFINSMSFDLNAEYLISCLLESGVKANEINAIFDGHLKRTWSDDIDFSEIETFENGEKVLALHLNRSGIYDLLPQALFHKFSEKESSTGEEMAKESMALKIEEKETRSFFRPFENEIFLQKVKIATAESNILEQVSTDFLNGLINDFWNIDTKISKKYTSRLVKALPFACKITGDYELTAQCLQFILNEKVNIQITTNPVESNTIASESAGKLGSTILGNDSICGSFTNGFIGKLICKIGPIKNTETTTFIANGDAKKLVECFYKYFVPIELDVETQLIFEKQENDLLVFDDSEESKSFLGINTFL